MPLKKVDPNIWRYSNGSLLQVCVVEELDDSNDIRAESFTMFGGFALCPEHFFKVTNLIKDGTPMGRVVEMMMTEKF